MHIHHPKPHGGKLVNLLVNEAEAEQLKSDALGWPSVTLSERQINELEMLLNGAFSPLQGYMNEADYRSVLETMRLSDGTVFPVPICLDINPEIA